MVLALALAETRSTEEAVERQTTLRRRCRSVRGAVGLAQPRRMNAAAVAVEDLQQVEAVEVVAAQAGAGPGPAEKSAGLEAAAIQSQGPSLACRMLS